uniref:Retinol dehydrogenase 11 n=1 Tax=Cacopsylla melanoneura TaxID=428564 RepID=A0A8D8TR98_9HEMI
MALLALRCRYWNVEIMKSFAPANNVFLMRGASILCAARGPLPLFRNRRGSTFRVQNMFFFSNRCISDAFRLDNKTVIVTGSNTGIGKVTVKELAKRGAKVIMACRSSERAQKAAEDIRMTLKDVPKSGQIVTRVLDLSSLSSVRQCAQEILDTEPSIHILINNAGIMMCPKQLSEDGYELQFATNHLGHYLFTLLLLPRMIKSAPARIINLSSLAHTWGDGSMHLDDINYDKAAYSPTGAYGRSKLANILFTVELARRLEGAKVTTYAVHPGVVDTELSRHFDSIMIPGMAWLYQKIGGLFIKSPEQGAQTTLYCALDENCVEQSGLYYADCKVKEPARRAKNTEKAKDLWTHSWKLVGLNESYDPFQPN